MKFMLIIYKDPALEPKYNTPEFEAMSSEYYALNTQMGQDGVLVAGDALMGVDQAVSVRVSGDDTDISKGPGVQTEHELGGFYVLDVPDQDAALAYAKKIPTAAFGIVEVRPIVEY